MALLFCDGFDKYGNANNQGIAATTAAALTAGEWTSTINLGSSVAIVPGLSAIGYALQFIATVQNLNLLKTLATSYSRLIGGIRIQSPLTAACGVAFADSGSFQCGIQILTTGQLSLRTGSALASVTATSTVVVSAGSTHYLEWDITFGASAAYNIYLDGVSIMSGTGATKTTGNSTANQFTLIGSGSNVFVVDDLYLFDTTGSTNNAVLLTSPQIETQYPSGDSSVQFSFGAAVLGNSNQGTTNTNAPGANELFLRSFTTGPSSTLASVSCIPGATSASAKFKAVVYADSSGPTGSTKATGTEVTGTTSGTTLTSAFSSPPTLAASTVYWLGFITDTSVVLQETDSNSSGQKAANTYGSGPPSNPTMTVAQPSWTIWGNLGSPGVNWYEESTWDNPPPGDVSYVSDSTSGHEDLYSFPALTTPNPATIYAVAVKGYIRKTDSGTRTVNLQCHSSSTDSAGTNSGIAPATTYGWLDSFFETDPNGSIAWTATAVNAATSGFKVAS
jgi:hypothetical protein